MRNSKAFSLVELSIVLVILGLLVGGVLSGQSLIHAAEMRSITSEFQRYAAAYNTFRGKYFAAPGDMNNATQFWGSAGGSGSDYACQTTASTTSATCNGNGDGMIGWPTSTIPGGTSTSDMGVAASELSRFWQHLANAGLIEGQYTGLSNVNSSFAWSPEPYSGNSPQSKMGGAYWMPSGRGGEASAGSSSNFAYNGANKELALNDGSGMYAVRPGSSPLFKPEDAWNIDTKNDDGKPGTGKVYANKTDCTTASGIAPPGDANADYLLSATTKMCGLTMVYQ